MSLHDRIMALPVTFCSGPDGWTIASEAAGVAKEADELMAEMAEALEKIAEALDKCTWVEQSEAINAEKALGKYSDWKEQN